MDTTSEILFTTLTIGVILGTYMACFLLSRRVSCECRQCLSACKCGCACCAIDGTCSLKGLCCEKCTCCYGCGMANGNCIC